MGMGFRIIISHGAREEGGGCLARSTLLAPSPSLFPSEEMPAGAATAAATAFMYLLGEPVLGGRGKRREREKCWRAKEDHHLVPVRPCVCACKCLPPSPSRSFPPPRTRRRRGGRGRERMLLTTNRRRSFRQRGCSARVAEEVNGGGAINTIEWGRAHSK